jgi:DNA sulfur modification protein DndB
MSSSKFGYQFPSLKGIQAGREYFISQCPIRLLPRIFAFDDSDLPVEARAQRTLNKDRVPEITRYILQNRNEYVFSAITASIDADVTFTPLDSENPEIGVLSVPLSARFIVNDGQHRRAALSAALETNPELGDETIAVVFFIDVDLRRSQQMFADLNRHGVKPSVSIGVLYDHREPLAEISRKVVRAIPLLQDLVEYERTTLAPRSRKLFTFSAIHTANSSLLIGSAEQQIEIATVFWNAVIEAFPEWSEVHNKRLSASEVRQDFVHSHGTVLHAIGKVGNAMIREKRNDWTQLTAVLASLNWLRTNATDWEGRVLIGGRVSKSNQSVLLTSALIKEKLNLGLTNEETRLTNSHKGQNT